MAILGKVVSALGGKITIMSTLFGGFEEVQRLFWVN